MEWTKYLEIGVAAGSWVMLDSLKLGKYQTFADKTMKWDMVSWFYRQKSHS
jgi:hypothetical protein